MTSISNFPFKKKLHIENGPTHAYVYIASRSSKPTLLLLHGFPSSSYDWHHQISSLTTVGYGVVVPDMLGYGETDKPTAVEEYAQSRISSHVAKILEHEGLTQVIGVAHDWGVGTLSKMWNYFPQYFSGLVFLSEPYTPPGRFDLDGLNQVTKAAFGVESFGYMHFFNDDDAASVIEARPESLLSLIYSEKSDFHISDLCPKGKARAWTEAGRTAPLPSWEPAEVRQFRLKEFEKGGWTGPTNWYKAAIRDVDAGPNSRVSPENINISKPVVFVGGDIDSITRPQMSLKAMERGKEEGWLTDAEFKMVKGGGHWMILEQPEQIFEILDGLAKKVSIG